ncbi:hypothetical protein ANCDUO_12979 [Ancylostoma duodenale]|uniref:DUF3752 domain-containing protein n=1 Tax=Ancylostoma duodenale TaxID=51022 RepID=A0A0C2GD97_9BILA|nr:hypothetical protein ANCDUO_12979 [Ancylostoma duodenale]
MPLVEEDGECETPVGPALPPKMEIGPALPPKMDIGPALPPKMNIGPALPPKMDIGPALPPKMDIGPALPPKMDDCEKALIGPALPSEMNDCEETLIGPALPPEMDDCQHFGPSTSSSECDIGPLPAKELDNDQQAMEYVRRRLELDAKKTAENKPVREEWLTKVPKQGVIAGLTARTFKRSKATSEFDESWEETPQTKRAATQGRNSVNDSVAAARNQKNAAVHKELDKNRSESLIDMHMKERRKGDGKNSTSNPGERIPFNRDVEMGHGGSSKASIEQVKERAGKLSTRFGAKEYL